MLERKFNVQLIEKMGDKGMREAWLTSKPTLTYKDEADLQSYLDNVIDNDLPLAGFHLYCLKIGSSLLFRDLMFSLRPIQVWATSSRIVKIKNLGMESNYPISAKARQYYDMVEKAQEAGEALDTSKRYCPLQQYTEFCIVIDLRTLMVFARTIQECDNELFYSHVVPILKLLKLEERFKKMHTDSIYSKLSVHNLAMAKTDNSDGIYFEKTTESYELNVHVAFCLGAQFLRQHYARVRSSIWNELKEKGYRQMLTEYNSSTRFYYSSSAEYEQWQRVCTRRTCFVAQFDWKDEYGWDFIIGKWVDGMTHWEFKENLPCKGCGANCNIFNETKLRLFTKRKDRERWTNNPPDENVPCPLLVEDPKMILERGKMYHSNSIIYNKWVELCKHIKDNPENKARLFYEGKTDECPNDTSYLDKH